MSEQCGLRVRSARGIVTHAQIARTPQGWQDRQTDRQRNCSLRMRAVLRSGSRNPHDAISARAVAVRRVLKGDKGDGRRVARAQARARYAHINAGTVPDIIALRASPSGHHHLRETKVSHFAPPSRLGTQLDVVSWSRHTSERWLVLAGLPDCGPSTCTTHRVFSQEACEGNTGFGRITSAYKLINDLMRVTGIRYISACDGAG